MNALLSGISNDVFTASSTFIPDHSPFHSRLLFVAEQGWRPKATDAFPWIQVHFGTPRQVEGILISLEFLSHVQSTFDISSSRDDSNLKPIGGPFPLDNKLVYRNFVPVVSQIFRLILNDWNSTSSIWWSLFGCTAGI